MEFQKIKLRRWVFRFGFFGVFRGSCLATFNEKPEWEKDSGFSMPECKRHYVIHYYFTCTRAEVEEQRSVEGGLQLRYAMVQTELETQCHGYT